MKYLVIVVLAATACSANTLTPREPQASPAPMTCEQRVAQARAHLDALDPSVDGQRLRLDALPISGGASTLAKKRIVVSDAGAALMGHRLPTDPHELRAILSREAGYRMTLRDPGPLYLVLAPAMSATNAAGWLELLREFPFPPFLLLVRTGEPPQQPPTQIAKHPIFKRLDGSLKTEIKESNPLWDEAIEVCPPIATMLNRSHYPVDSVKGMRMRADEAPDALLACECRADVDTVVALLYAWNASRGTTIVRSLPVPTPEMMREAAAKHPGLTVQGFIDLAMDDKELARALSWLPYVEAHRRARK